MESKISKSQFKARALELFREIESTGESLVVTDHGRPALEVRLYRSRQREPLEVLRNSVITYTNPTEPVGDDMWEAVRDPT